MRQPKRITKITFVIHELNSFHFKRHFSLLSFFFSSFTILQFLHNNHSKNGFFVGSSHPISFFKGTYLSYFKILLSFESFCLPYCYMSRKRSKPDTCDSNGQESVSKKRRLDPSVTVSTKIWRIEEPKSGAHTNGTSIDHSTELYKYYKTLPEIIEAGELIKQGELVAFPTETVYGLGANALDDKACQKIFVAKGRPSDNPLIVHICEFEQLDDLTRSLNVTIPEVLLQLAKHFWPGPLSIVIPHLSLDNSEENSKENSKEISGDNKSTFTTGTICKTARAGLSSVAVRMPSHPIARALIYASKVPIAAPSANTSGRPSPTSSQHVHKDLFGKIAGIIDGGDCVCSVGLESTVVKLRSRDQQGAESNGNANENENGKEESDNKKEELVILRPGGITLEMIREVVDTDKYNITYAKEVSTLFETSGVQCHEEDPHFVDDNVSAQSQVDLKPEAPGMKYKHYSPEKPLYLVANDKLLQDILDVLSKQHKTVEIGVLVSDENHVRHNTKYQHLPWINIHCWNAH
ncbi:hypothetical protein RFI_14565 [Reticulomyxa filosa]|uniref:Threonylcarbamoyl-AMP synthase n=1 Tax=Reticulomyxa filosa TaxID=46433 RepID=X6N9N1_RETFI|nr:hypothetical protein RFI_14565 [Reticulomyxa filosa]|eukprot:ETO22628.1 hypothetical protein RFI_14565 [Reticulomyxa filosa]